MNRFLMLSSSAFISFLATSAYAADAISTQEPVPLYAAPTFTWDGAYIGGQIGYTMTKKGKYSFGDLGETTAKSNGFLGGIYAGTNFDIGNNVVLGADLDFTTGSKKAPDHDGNYAIYVTTQTRWSGAARARLGYAADRFLPYIAGGLAIGSFKDSLTTPFTEFKSDKVRTGWTIGGGVDYAFTDNVILRAEYRYTDFGKQNFNLNNSADFSRKLSSNDIRVGVAYKF